MDSAGLVDTFRYLHPEKREFSRNDKFRGSSARIDAILVSSSLANDVTNVQHIEYKRSDHKFVITSLRRREENQSQKLSIRSNSPWKLHPHNCFDFHFKLETINWVEMLLQMEGFKRRDIHDGYLEGIQKHASGDTLKDDPTNSDT